MEYLETHAESRGPPMQNMTATDSEPEGIKGSMNLPPPQYPDDRRARWARLLRDQHYEPVIIDVLRDELPKYTNSRLIDPTDLTTHMRECALILASAPKCFFAAVEGNLVRRMAQDADLKVEYAEIQQRSRHQPSIYIHLLADNEGKAPTPAQYLLIRDAVVAYLEEGQAEFAYQIDNITPPLVSLEALNQGQRKYLTTATTFRSATRIASLHRLCTGISTRCAQIPTHLQHHTLPYPPSEVGYALHAPIRLAQHRAHRSSNYVMNLIEDICTHLFRTKTLSQHFTMHQFIVYLIFRPKQAAIAEIFVSGLSQAWVEEGGFNAYPAGRSVSSAEKVGVEEWRENLLRARRNSGLVERMGVLRERAEVWKRALEWEGVGEDKHGEETKQDRDEEMEVEDTVELS